MEPRTPPVRPLAERLPWNDLSDRQFENAMRDLLRELGFQNVEFYGAPGNPQEGIDLRADRDEARYGVQVKRRTQFDAGDAKTAVEATTFEADRFILALSRRATVGVQKELDKHEKWEIWDEIRLSDAVRELPHARAVDYIERHFHPAHVETFLGRPRATTFIDRDMFFAPARFAQLVTHNWQRVGPRDPLEQIRAFLDNADARVAIVAAPTGIGKTKLLYDATLTPSDDLHIYFVSPNVTITQEALRELRAGPCLVIVDDADECEGIKGLLAHAARRDEVKVLLTCSAANRAPVVRALFDADYEPAQLRDVTLERLGREPTIALVQQVLGHEDARIEEAVVQYAIDSPLNTILTTRLFRDRTLRVDATEDQVRDLLSALFRDVASGEVAAEVPRAHVQGVLQVLAATAPAKIEDDEWLAATAAFVNITIDDVLRVLDALDDAGVLLRRGFHYTIAPEIVRHGILKEACIARARASTFAKRLYAYFPRNIRLLRNVALVEVDAGMPHGRGPFAELWPGVVAEMRTANSLERLMFVEHLEELAYVKPDEIFQLAAYLLDHPATNDDSQPQPFGPKYIIRHDSVVRKIPALLRAVMIASPDHMLECIEILWRLGRDGSSVWAHDDPLRIIKSMAEYEPGISSVYAERVLDAIDTIIARGEPDSVQHCLLEFVAPILARDVHTFISRGTQAALYRGVVDVESLRGLRDRAIAVLAAAALGTDDRRADLAICDLVTLPGDPMHAWRAATPEAEEAWNRERNLAFDAFDAVVREGRWPLRELRLEEKLRWHVERGPTAAVRERAKRTLGSMAPSEDRDRFRSLISSFRRPEDFVDIREVSDFDLGAERAAEFLTRIVQQWIAEHKPTDFLADVAERLDVIDASHIGGSQEDIFRALTYIAPEYGVRVRDAILAGGNARFYRNVAPFVQAALVREPENGTTIARRLLATGDSDAASAVAAALGYRLEQPNPEDEARRLALFREVFAFEDSLVRRRAAFSFGFFRFDYPATAAPTVAQTPVGTDSAFAEDLYSTLQGRDIDDALVQPLIDNLREVDDLDYWPTDFLRRIAPTRSNAVLQFLLERIRLRTGRDNYHPIPHADVTFGPLVDALLESQTFEVDFLEIIAEYHMLSSLEQFWFDMLYGYVAARAPEMAKRLIAGALAAEDEATRSMAVRWLHRAPHALLTGDIGYVVRLMERGCAVSEHLGEAVYAAIVGALTSGASALAPYEPAPGDQRLMDVSAAALHLDLSMCARRWFERMQARGQAEAERTIRESEETFGPR